MKSPVILPVAQLLTWSIAAEAAEAADDLPRALMISLPRCWTVFRKSPSNQDESPIASVAGSPAIVASNQFGNIVGEWLPHTPRFFTEDTGRPDFAASCAAARFWSRRVIAV